MIVDAVVIASILHTAWCVTRALGTAGDTIDRAPWPHARQTPEPPRLRIVRCPHIYDWQREDVA